MFTLVNSGKMANLVTWGLMELKKGERIGIANQGTLRYNKKDKSSLGGAV